MYLFLLLLVEEIHWWVKERKDIIFDGELERNGLMRKKKSRKKNKKWVDRGICVTSRKEIYKNKNYNSVIT